MRAQGRIQAGKIVPLASRTDGGVDIADHREIADPVPRQLEAARDFYQKAATTDPSWAKPILQLGIMASNQGQTEAAIAQLKKVLDVDPKSAEAVEAEALLKKISR